MENKAKPQVTIVLDKERHLPMNFTTLIDYEAITGKNMLKHEAVADMSATDLCVLLWAALKQEDEELTLKDVGKLLDFRDMAYIAERIAEAMEEARPEGEGQSEGPLVKNR